MSAFNDGSNVAKEESSSDIFLKTTLDLEDHGELEEGRVRRRGASATSVDKQNSSGPVLRTTVKPVKRFRPDSTCDKTNPSPVRKKRVKCSRESSVGNGKNNSDALQPHCNSAAGGFDSSPDAKLSMERHHEKSDVKIVSDKPPANPVQDDSEQPIPKKKKRVWEQWTQEDKDYFFEAVAMYGKDFESIRTAIAHKHRKKGEDCVAKTKDQVRHLYYRTWTMISKLIDQDSYPLNINRAFQELYAIINYGEIRKRLGGSLKKKGIEKLNELIKDGSTSTRIKGKTFRIKTPACRALKKMNPAYQGKEGILDLPLISDTRRMKIPLQITLELFPLTMAAWNQVHSIAHNPRLKIRINAHYQLSAVFAHLERKWKPLSTKLLRIASQSTSKTISAKLGKNQMISSSWDKTLAFQTPPDASLNTRNMVFQVMNSKTHCIVSYALRKSSQSRDKVPPSDSANRESVKEPLTEIKDAPDSDMANSHPENNPGAISESELIDSCPSSEEDYDYDSANEAAFKDGCSEHEVSKIASEKKSSRIQDYVCESLNTSFTLKEKESDTADRKTPLPDCSQTTTTLVSVSSSTSSINLAQSVQNVVCSTHLVNGELSIDITSVKINGSLGDASESALVDDRACSTATKSQLYKRDSTAVDVKDIVGETSSKPRIRSVNSMQNHCDEAKLKPEGVISSIITSPVNNTDCKTIDSAVKINLCAKTKENENSTPAETKLGKKLVLSTKLFGKVERKKQKNVKLKKTTKPLTKTVQTWTAKDCRKITIAEIYMMLGKPSVFKLYYKWIQATTPSAESTQPSVDFDRQKMSVSTGLMALIQAAKLTRLLKEKNNVTAENESINIEAPVYPKVDTAVVQKLQKTKNTSVQCELIKPGNKADEKSCSTSSSTTSMLSSNPHGRGVSKIVPVSNVVADALPIAFAMPMIPANKPRRIAADPTKPVKGTMVSPETMNWLLQQSSRGRRSRKPIVGNRSQAKSNQPSLRRMKTFSIVTCGPNKVGFLPSKPILSSRPVVTERMALPSSGSEALAETPSTVANSRTMNTVSSTSAVTLNIDELLGLESNTRTRMNIASTSLDINLLAQAAKEAGVAPVTPSKESALENNMISCTQTFKSQIDTGASIISSNVKDSTTVSANASVSTFSIQSPTKEISGLFTNDLNIKLPATSSPRSYIAPLTTSNSDSSSELSSPLLTLPVVDVVSSSVDTLMECSWSNHGFVPGIFPSLSDNLVDKLVHGANDITLSSLTNSDTTKKPKGKNNTPSRSSPLCVINENSNSPTSRSLSSVNFDIHMTPIKSSDLPIHPWTINTNSRDSMGLSGLLNTPQKLIPSDMEDSFDGLLQKSHIMEDDRKKLEGSNGNALEVESSSQSKKSDTDFKLQHTIQVNTSSSNFLADTDPEVELQLQCMLNENSVDYISKFQDLVRQTTEYEELPVIAHDDNACDGHHPPISPSTGLCQSLKSNDALKDNG